jgi:ankyrin repeat protein
MTREFVGVLFAAALIAAEGSPPIIEAAKSADMGALRALLSKKPDVNAAEGDGTTALHWASYRDNWTAAALLLGAGANVNAANDLGATPLWMASQNGSAAMVKQLLEAGANPNLALMSGETPLMAAARGGKSSVIASLLAHGAKTEERGTRGQTALMWAAAQKHPGAVKALLAGGADVHARSGKWSEMMAVPPHGYLPYNKQIPHGGYTALLFAARSGDLESVKLLLTAGANANDQDAWGVTAVVLAAHSGFTELAEFLLTKGADPNLAGAGFSALHNAIMRRDERLVRALLARGADPNFPIKTWTPVRRSAQDFHFEPQLVGATPYWLAARFLQPRVMRLLAEAGADPLFVHRAEYVAGERFERRTESATAVLAALGVVRAKPWVDPPDGAREALAREAVRFALERGVDINATGADGRTALDVAKANRWESVVGLLTEKGATSGR